MSQIENNPADVTARESLSHAQLVAAVTPGIEAIRTDMFGSAAAPFASHAEAVTWIEHAPPYRAVGRKRALALIRHVTKETGGRAVVEFASPCLRYWKPGSQTALSIGAAVGSVHARLGARAEALVTGTGWYAAKIVIWVLADVEPPPVPRLRFRAQERFSGTLFPGGPRLYRKTVTLELYDYQFRDTEWLGVLRAVRLAFNGKPKWEMKDKHQILFDIVQKMGDKPRRGETWTAHWQAVARAYTQKSGSQRYASPQSCRTAWTRLEKKLQDIRPWELRGKSSTTREVAQ